MAGVLEWMLNPMGRDDESNLEAILHGVTAYRLGDKALDVGANYLMKDPYQEQNAKLDILLKRRQLDLMDSDKYNAALNDDGRDMSLERPAMLELMRRMDKWTPSMSKPSELQSGFLQSILSSASKEPEANPLIGLLQGGSKYGPVRSPVGRNALLRIARAIE